MQALAKQSGVPTVSITNDPESPLALASDICLPLHAGPERSVAATKTFVVSAVLGAAIVATISGDARLLGALQNLPQTLHDAQGMESDEL